MCGRLMSPAHETQSMREIRLIRGRLPRKGGGVNRYAVLADSPSINFQKDQKTLTTVIKMD